MSEPVWFVAEQFRGRLMFSLAYDRLPGKFTDDKRAKANGLVAAIRIDDKPQYAGYSLDDLRRVWLHPWGALRQ